MLVNNLDGMFNSAVLAMVFTSMVRLQFHGLKVLQQLSGGVSRDKKIVVLHSHAHLAIGGATP